MRYRRAYVASDVGSLVTQLRSESKESGVSVVDPAMSKKVSFRSPPASPN
jgi:hypothetical protein